MKKQDPNIIDVKLSAAKLDTDTLLITQKMNDVAHEMVIKINKFIDSAVLAAMSVGDLTRLRQQINTELKSRGIK
jgi:hypothetical protein